VNDAELLDLHDRECAAYLAYVKSMRGDGLVMRERSSERRIGLLRSEWVALLDELQTVDPALVRIRELLRQRGVEGAKVRRGV
jgi:hypothetical protein